ncbi:MAG: 5'/3'-nucleotidase SurE [Pseudomonadota bacterium]
MRILITNDDGINAPGLAVLDTIAREIAGPDGEVWTVAPAQEQSGVAHCISYTRPLLLTQLEDRRFTTDGAPADCVIAGLWQVMADARPDLILSGVNRGNNAAENTLYSGTLGACIEASLQGVPSVGLSQFYGPANAGLPDPFEASAIWGVRAVQACLEAGFDTDAAYPLFYNVNFPPVPAADVKGLAAVAQGRRHGIAFGAKKTTAPNGRDYLWISGGNQQAPTDPGTDAQANLDGHVSITPMRADLTAGAALSALRDQLG